MTFNEVNDLQEVQDMLKERVKDWTKSWKRQAIEEGRKIGWQEGDAELVLNLPERRFGLVDELIRARVKSTDTQTLLIWSRSILNAQSIEEVFKH